MHVKLLRCCVLQSYTYVVFSCTQVAKLLIIPFVCAVEAVCLGRRFTAATICCIVTVVVGVAVV